MLTEDLIAAVPLPMVVIGRNARVRALNSPAEHLLGAALRGRHYVAGLRQPPVVEAIESALSGRVAVGQHVSSQGSERHWRVTASPAGDAVILAFEDLTALDEAERMRREFVANVSHELRTPLTAMTGFIETLRGAARDDTAARERFLAIMAREAARMSRLVDDLLSLGRVEAEGRARPARVADLGAVVRAATQALRPRAEAAGVALEVALPEVPVALRGDADQLQQVLANLIENALKYGAAGGVVRVALAPPVPDARLRGPAARIDVIDRGEGIDHIHLPRLTERFYRVDAHRSREMGGTGLGLAIVKHIVARHRGRLEIESAPGQGSRFSVLLPAEPGEPTSS